MKITLLLVTVLAFLCFVDGKPHNDGKRAHQIKRAKEHEMTNRMGHGEHHRREHTTTPHRPETPDLRKMHKTEAMGHKSDARKPNIHKKAEAMNRRGDGIVSSASPVHDIRKDLHLQHVTEHNIQKKQQDDKDGIPMESERLIHVTPRPLKVHKVNKPHHKPTLATGLKANVPLAHARPAASKAKAHKPPKKYSPKKHGWKKSMRKEKGKDKAKKNEKREKRNKALHRAIVARNL